MPTETNLYQIEFKINSTEISQKLIHRLLCYHFVRFASLGLSLHVSHINLFEVSAILRSNRSCVALYTACAVLIKMGMHSWTS